MIGKGWVGKTLFIGELSPTGKKNIGELGPVTKNPWVIWAAQKNIGDLDPTEKKCHRWIGSRRNRKKFISYLGRAKKYRWFGSHWKKCHRWIRSRQTKNFKGDLGPKKIYVNWVLSSWETLKKINVCRSVRSVWATMQNSKTRTCRGPIMLFFAILYWRCPCWSQCKNLTGLST